MNERDARRRKTADVLFGSLSTATEAGSTGSGGRKPWLTPAQRAEAKRLVRGGVLPSVALIRARRLQQ